MWVFWITLVVMIVGLVGVILPAVPGVELIWIAALIYAIAEGFATIDPFTFILLTIFGLVGFTADIWVSQTGGKLAGASWQALAASLGLGALGFLIGLLFGGVGAVPGGLIGAIGGVILVEYQRHQDWKEAARAGAGWAAGCLVSIGIQFILGVTMVLIFVWQALRG
jgi:hypothetical protein